MVGYKKSIYADEQDNHCAQRGTTPALCGVICVLDLARSCRDRQKEADNGTYVNKICANKCLVFGRASDMLLFGRVRNGAQTIGQEPSMPTMNMVMIKASPFAVHEAGMTFIDSVLLTVHDRLAKTMQNPGRVQQSPQSSAYTWFDSWSRGHNNNDVAS